MKKYVFCIILLINIIYNNETEVTYPNMKYGYYCGLWHYNRYGLAPYDILDRVCQIHDICTSIGMMNCYCNQQLLVSTYNIKPGHQNMTDARNSILRYMYYAILNCYNHHDFDKQIILGTLLDKGFNYLPLYKEQYDQKLDVSTEYKLFFVKLCDDYDIFTKDVYNNTSNVLNYKYNILNGNGNIVNIDKNCNYVLYNYNNEFNYLLIKNITDPCINNVLVGVPVTISVIILTLSTLCILFTLILILILVICCKKSNSERTYEKC